MTRRARWFVFPLLVLLASVECAAQRTPIPGEAARTFTVSGMLRYDDTGGAAEMIKIDLKRFTGESIATTFTRSNGDFEFHGVTRGNYYIVVEEEGYEPVKERVEIFNSDRRGVVLNLAKGLQIETRQPSGQVSARELQLPAKAREAYQKGTERLYSKKDAKGSLSHFRRALEVSPSYYEAYFQLGVGHLQVGEMAEAETAFRKSIELSNTSYAEPHVGLAAILCNARKFAECEASARRGVELDANSWQGHFQLARALVGNSQLDGAENALKTVVKLKPDYAESYLVYANIYIRKQDFPGLLKVLDEYLRLEPNGPMSPSVRETRAAVERKLASDQQAQNAKQKP